MDWVSETNEIGRSKECEAEIRALMLFMEFIRFTDASRIASRLVLSTRDLVIVVYEKFFKFLQDNVEASSWQRFLCYNLPGPSDPPRENDSRMLEVDYALVRPDLSLAERKEARLKVFSRV